MVWGILYFVISFLIYFGVSFDKKNNLIAHALFMVAGSLAAIAGLYLITNIKVMLIACVIAFLANCYSIWQIKTKKIGKES